MTMGRKLITFLILTLAILGLFYALNNASSPILTSNARAIPISDNVYAVYLDLQNVGAPDMITGVVAKNATRAFIMGGTSDEGLAIPTGSKPSFSSDGAHIMLMFSEQNQITDNKTEGKFIPMSLVFENAGAVAVKAIIKNSPQMSAMDNSNADDMAMMDHSLHDGNMVFEIDSNQTSNQAGVGNSIPSISMNLRPNQDKTWLVDIQTSNFEFFEPVTMPLVHTDGQGHGHLYLNGLKLQRMYSNQAVIGALPAGKHTISVTLNTNDHRAYSIDGTLVSAAVDIVVE